jgi:acid stress-induced BolA-like protein IbaG/YrbA
MNSEQIAELLKSAFPHAEIAVTGQAGKFDLRIVDTQFDGVRPVARQQLVYAPLNEHIASGAIHAVTIRAMTAEEWRKASLFGA